MDERITLQSGGLPLTEEMPTDPLPSTPITQRAALPELSSTPQSGGMSSVHDSLNDLERDTLLNPVVEYLRKHQTCDFVMMLKDMLRDIWEANGGTADPSAEQVEETFKQALDEVTRLCNEGDEVFQVLATEYCAAKTEEQRFPKLIKLLNAGLDLTRRVKIPNLRAAYTDDQDQFFFHRNDPRSVIGDHPSSTNPTRKSIRKPDAAGVRLESASRARLNDNNTAAPVNLREYMHEHALSSPRAGRFSWRDFLVSLELKAWRLLHTKPLPARWSSKFSAQKLPPPLAISKIVGEQPQPNNAQTAGSSTSGGASGCVHSDAVDVGQSTPSRKRSASQSNVTDTNAPQAKRTSSSRQTSNQGPEGVGHTDTGTQAQTKVLVQNALYGMEMLCSSAAQTHAWTLIIIDDVLYICYFDKEGMIQTTALNFIQDLPYLLVMLLAMQRFTDANWGRGDFFKADQSTPKNPEQDCQLLEFDDYTVTIDMNDRIRQPYTALGRSTWVFPVIEWKDKMVPSNANIEQSSGSPSARASASPPLHKANMMLKSQKREQMVLKLQWSEVRRTMESDVIQECKLRAESRDDGIRSRFIVGHLPEVFAAKKISNLSTAERRRRLHTKLAEDGRRSTGARELRVILMRRLKPIFELQGELLLGAFWDCVHCHFHLWKLGIRHRDISLHNLMYEIINEHGQQKVRGVLNDFDPATVDDKSPSGNERTGTLIFMARALLTDAGWRGELDHFYRYDVESFVWVILYLVTNYADGSPVPVSSKTHVWAAADRHACSATKANILDDMDVLRMQYSHTNPDFMDVVIALHSRLWQMDQKLPLGKSVRIKEPDPEVIYEHFLRAEESEYERIKPICPGIEEHYMALERQTFVEDKSAQDKRQSAMQRVMPKVEHSTSSTSKHRRTAPSEVIDYSKLTRAL